MGNCTDVVFFYRYPHEVIRSHAHVQGLGPFEGLFGLIGRIYKDGGGWRAFCELSSDSDTNWARLFFEVAGLARSKGAVMVLLAKSWPWGGS